MTGVDAGEFPVRLTRFQIQPRELGMQTYDSQFKVCAVSLDQFY